METGCIQKQFFKVPVEVSGWQSPKEERLSAAVKGERQNRPALGTAPGSQQDKSTAYNTANN